MNILSSLEFKIVPPILCDCYDENDNYIKTINIYSYIHNR